MYNDTYIYLLLCLGVSSLVLVLIGLSYGHRHRRFGLLCKCCVWLFHIGQWCAVGPRTPERYGVKDPTPELFWGWL